jgi:hypothetical protein
VNRSRILKTIAKWSSNGYRSVLWSELVSVLESLGFSVKPKAGTEYLISHHVLAANLPDFSPAGAFVVHKPHKSGDPVDPGPMKKKIIPAIEMVLQSLSVEDERHEAGY